MTARVLRAALVLGAALAVPLPPAAFAQPARAGSVLISVASVSPSTPLPSQQRRPLTVQLRLTNTTDQPLNDIRILAERGDPISTQEALDAALADRTPPASGLNIEPTRAVTVDLPAGATVQTSFATTSQIPNNAGLCVCAAHAVYPLFFSARIPVTGAADEALGTAVTFVPSFYEKPKPVRVSWVWPLIDRPHRLLEDTVFTDDALADLLVGDGRLSRALAVVESVGPDVPITLVIDPELLDELEVMSTGGYTVRTGAGRPQAGAGQAAATDWLNRLQAVLDNDPKVEVGLTPYADPDLESLTQAGLSWDTMLPSAMSGRVTQALGGRAPDMDIAWPASRAIGRRTLDSLAGSGTGTVVLGSSSVVPSPPGDGGAAISLATLGSRNGPVTAALTTAAMTKYVRAAVSLRGSGAAALPQLTAELAVQAASDPGTPHFVLLAPPRYVDPSPEVAARTIQETSASPFSQPVALRSASTAGAPIAGSRLRKLPAGSDALPDQILADASSVSSRLAGVNDLLGDGADAQPLLGALPQALQRVESAAWRRDSASGGPALGIAQAQALADRVDGIMSGVHIVSPSSGSYTLASSNSPLPITVENELDFTVEVKVQVNTVSGLPGFTAEDVGAQRIGPHSKQTLHLPTRVERSGRIQVQAVLSTPDGAPLGKPVLLFVHSTVLGAVGVIITVVAGAVLVTALLVRLVRRTRRRRKRAAAAA